ncbi:MAG: hypothetical protein M3332_09600 [Actinomycetota bacterium]|nr:hypothetical protein [Actinomycetota bacterium]
MIPRKDPGYYPSHRKEPPAPLDDEPHEPSLFTPMYAPLRKIIVMVDENLLRGGWVSESPRVAVTRLLERPNVWCYRYPINLDDAHHPLSDSEAWPGRIALRKITVHRSDDVLCRSVQHHGEIEYRNGERVVRDYFSGHADGTRLCQDDDIRASLVAGTIGVDLYVTERATLLEQRRWLRHHGHYPSFEPPCYSPQDAVALIGLYLRAQGDYTVLGETDPRRVGGPTARKMFYWTGARAILPTIWRWHVAFSAGSADAAGAELCGLAYTVAERIEEALAERDSMHFALNRDEDSYSRNAVFRRLENCLQLLLGALDASARIAHAILRTAVGADEAGPASTVAWHKGKWLKALRKRYPDLAFLVARDTPGWHVLTLLRLLRNSIHAESIMNKSNSAIIAWGFYPLLTLTADPEDELRQALQVLSNETGWTLGQKSPGDTVDPGGFLENLFPLVVRLLDNLMRHTPIEEVPDIARRLKSNPKADVHQPPHLCWQLGITPT